MPKPNQVEKTPAAKAKRRSKKRSSTTSSSKKNAVVTRSSSIKPKKRKSATSEVHAINQSLLYAAEDARRDEQRDDNFSSPLPCGGGATTTRGRTPSQEKETSTRPTNHGVNEDSTPTAAVHSTTVSAARVSTIVSNQFREWNSTPLARGDKISTHVRVDTDTDEPHRNISITDTRDWLDFSLPFTINGGVWSDTSGFYVVRHGNVTKPGFIHDMFLHTRICQLFQGYCPEDVTVRFISTHDAHTRHNLAMAETFAKFCLYSQGRVVDGKNCSCYSGHSEVYLDVGLQRCNEIIAIVLTLLTSEDDFDPLEGGHDLPPITRKNWTRHPLIKKFLYSGALNARSRHTSCEFSLGDVNNEGRVFTNRWREYARTWHRKCSCMSAATPKRIREIFRKVLEDEENRGRHGDGQEGGGGSNGEGDGDEYEEEGGGGDGGDEEGQQDVEEKLIPGIGIRNPGNLCYINAILQVLFTCPEFIQDLCEQFHKEYSLVKKMPLIKALLEIAVSIGAIYEKDAPLISIRRTRGAAKGGSPLGLKQQMDLVTEQFHGEGQQDVHEFFGELINRVRYELAGISIDEQEDEAEMPLDDDNESTAAERDDNTDAAGSTVLPSDNFRMKVRETRQCTQCGYSRRSNVPYHDLSVAVAEDVNGEGRVAEDDNEEGPSVERSLKQFFQDEKYELKCEKCDNGTHVNVKKEIISG